MWNMEDGHARFLCYDYSTNHCSALCKALHCVPSLSPASRDWPAWRGRGETAPCHQHMHLENIFMYSRRMIVTILFYSAVDLSRTCSLVTLRQLLAVPATFTCFISGGMIYPLSLRKSTKYILYVHKDSKQSHYFSL